MASVARSLVGMLTHTFIWEFDVIGGVELLTEAEVTRRIQVMDRSLGSAGKAHGNQQQMSVHVTVSETDDETKARAESLRAVHDALDDSNLDGYFRVAAG